MKKNYHSSFLLVLMCLFTSFAFAQSGQKLLTIGCLSDLHCEGSNATNGVVKTSVSTTVQRMKQFEDVDVICIGGDITSQTSLSETQWQKCRNSTIDALISAFNKTTASTPLTGAKTATPLVIATGNHEFQACSAPKASYNSADYFNTLGSNSYGMQYYTGDLTSTTTSTVTANANEAFYETLSGNKDFNHVACAHYQINNIDFIIINTSSYNFNKDTFGSGWTFSTNQANWVAAKLNKIKADNPKRLVFVVEHFMFSDTNKTNSNHVMPDRDGTPILKKAYASYPNLIMLYGHDHSGDVYISSKTSERVTRYNTSGNKIDTTDKNHVDGTTQGTGSVTANSSFMSCFMGSMNYRSNTSLYQALMIYVYEDRIVFQTKDFNESTEANINKNTPYTFFYTDTTAPSEDPEPQGGELGDNEYYIVNGGKYLSNSGESLSLGSTPTAWTFAYSSNQFTVKTDRWLRCESASGSSGSYVFNTSGSSKKVYVFDASGNLVTSQSSLAENTPYYFVYNTGSSTYYYMSNAAFSYSSYTGLTAVKATISGSGSSMKLTVPTSNVSNYQFTLSKSAGSGPEPQPTTVTYYGTLAVSGTNGSVNVSTTSGVAGSSSVNVNKTVENTQANASQTLYLHATANENYEFLGWATSNSESAIISGSNVAEYAYNFTFDGTQSAPTSKTLYAFFKYVESQPSTLGDNEYYIVNGGKYLSNS
ncbi:MAG: metallophosphoesterase, partial [Bacteroidaceae bacterium]|nr:metallophosphoesterase [Bacteroidaceae bacterium]